jgi:hypothetical protein
MHMTGKVWLEVVVRCGRSSDTPGQYVEWSMQRLAYVLLILGVLGTLGSGVGDAPLVQFILDTPHRAGTLGDARVPEYPPGTFAALEQAVSQTHNTLDALRAVPDASGRLRR